MLMSWEDGLPERLSSLHPVRQFGVFKEGIKLTVTLRRVEGPEA